MRNKFPGTCYRCGEHVAAGGGHFERRRGGWRTQHASCAIRFRGTASVDRSGEADETSTKIEGSAEGESVVPAEERADAPQTPPSESPL